jgi:hypothetical protein
MPQVTQEELLEQLDRMKRKQRNYLAPSDYRDHMPSAIPNMPDRPDTSLLRERMNSVRGLSQAGTKETLIMSQNKRDYEAMMEAEARLAEAKKKLKNTDRPKIKIPVGQPNYVTQPMPVATQGPPKMGGGGPGRPGSVKAPAVNTSGPGWKDPTPGLGRVGTGSVKTINWRGRTLTLNANAVDNFVGFLNALAATGYNIQSIGSHNIRPITGGSQLSLHSYGLAIDINPAQNPYGPNLVTDMPKGVGRLAAKYGLSWGGNWNSVKDAMHFSIPWGGRE